MSGKEKFAFAREKVQSFSALNFSYMYSCDCSSSPLARDGVLNVLQILEHHRIDDLVVLDSNKHPIGVVDSQDLTRLKVL